MNKLCAAFILMMSMTGLGHTFPIDKRILAGVFEPGMIKVAENRLYVFEGASILTFPLQDLSLLYFLKYNEVSGGWELHTEEIK